MIHWAECKFIFTIACFLTFKIVTAQDPKPPEAVTDYATSIQGGRFSIPVLENDFADEGHPIKVISAVGSQNADVYFNDSTVFYIPDIVSWYYSYPDKDTVAYRIKDLENGLTSGFGKICLTLNSPDFDFLRDSLRINNYSSIFHACGSYFFDYFGNLKPCFEIPFQSGLSTIRKSNLLIGGKRSIYYTHLAGEFDQVPYRTDFWPGPISSTMSYSPDYDSVWNRVWKLTSSEIKFHQENWSSPGYFMPEAIQLWPGNGDAGQGQVSSLAPYLDYDDNGYYDPEMGDCPVIRGDQAIFSLFNDHRTVGMSTQSNSLGIEVHQTAYAFNCPSDSAFYNTFFVQYRIINRSENDYEDIYSGIYTAFNVGVEGDEYMGCDTVANCYFGYNDSFDESLSTASGYGDYPPAQAVVFLNRPLSSFIGPAESWYNGPGVHYSMLKGLWPPFGEPMTYGDDGIDGTDTTTFLFPGNPSDPAQWSDFQVNTDSPGIRNGVGAAGPFKFNAGDTLILDIAYVFARDYGGTNLTSVELLKERVEKIQWYYQNDSTPCETSWIGTNEQIVGNGQLLIAPNPAKSAIMPYPELENTVYSYEIYCATGRLIQKGKISGGQKIHISSLPPGYYFISFYNLEDVLSSGFIKVK